MLDLRRDLIEAVKACGVPEAEIREEVIASLLAAASFLYAGGNNPSVDYLDFSTKTAESARRLGVSKDQFVGAALKQPSLFYQKPETLESNVDESARRLGVSKDQFVGAALKQPQLFSQKPETLESKYRILCGFKAKSNPFLKEEISAVDFALQNPVVLCLAENNMRLRFIYARAKGLPAQGAATIFTIPTKRIESALVQAYGFNPDVKEIPPVIGPVVTKETRRHRALCAMVGAGLIKGYVVAPA